MRINLLDVACRDALHRWSFWLVAAVVLTHATAAFAQSPPKPLAFDEPYGAGPVYVIPIEGMIDNGLAVYLERALADAAADDAALAILHMDTFGGLVDAADKMRQTLLDATVPTVSFIDKNAASAGALISYATDRIVMVPGSSIGAATVVSGAGEAMPDKYQSYMRSQMRATAEAKGRDPRIAEAMVDPSLVVDGVVEEGKVLTLSAQEAERFGVADAVLPSLDDLLASFELAERERINHESTRMEQILRFFSSPVMQSILMLMMLGGLYFELQTPGVGFAGAMAATGALLFFGPHYVLGLVVSWELALFVVGVILIGVELFVLPGFGVAGIAGILAVIGSLFLSLLGNVTLTLPSSEAVASAVGTLAVSLVLLVTFAFSLGRYLPRTERFNRLVLQPSLESGAGYTSADTEITLIGQVGISITPLRPSGAIVVDDERIDVVTNGEFIPPGIPVKVVKVRGSRVEVRAVDTLPS